MDGEEDLNLTRLLRIQKEIAEKHANYLGLANQLVVITDIITWNNITKEKGYIIFDKI